MTDDLEPIAPVDAKKMYLKDRDVTAPTIRAHDRRLSRLCRWLEAEDVDNLNDLTGRMIHRFKIDEFDAKDNGGDYSAETIRSVMDTTRVFLRWCESIDAVPQGLSEKVQSPSPQNTRDESIDRDRAAAVLRYLATYEYASARHCLLDLLWHNGFRLGGVHSLDLCDADTDENYLEVRHRPDEGTTLKNGEDGERLTNISETTAQLLEDYIAENRIDVEDANGREPLITSKYGRRSKTNFRAMVYSATRPCVYTGECPHDRDPDTCEAMQNRNDAVKCPSSVYPHAFRRGSITHHLREDTPKHLVSDRMDVNPETLDKHYDTRSEKERMHQRRDYLPFDDTDDEDNK